MRNRVRRFSGSPPDGTPQIFLTTNGEIIADELIGNMLVGHVHSTENDVTLKPKESLTLRYGILVHQGDITKAQIEQQWKHFARDKAASPR